MTLDVFAEGHDGGAHGESAASGRDIGSLVGLTIVVIDDDLDTVDYFAMALRSRGAVVETAMTAVEGLRLVCERRPDAVLSDIAMVDRDGYWLIREIRGLSDEHIRHVPVVATTAYGRAHSEEAALRAGFNDYLAKPVDPDALWQTIAKVAGR